MKHLCEVRYSKERANTTNVEQMKGSFATNVFFYFYCLQRKCKYMSTTTGVFILSGRLLNVLTRKM